MTKKKGKIEEEQELADYYQAHKDEVEWEPVEYEKSATRAGGAYSIRFSPKELDGLRKIANREGKRISQIVREAVSQYIESQQEQRAPAPTVDWRKKQLFYFSGQSTLTTAVGPRLEPTMHMKEEQPVGHTVAA